MLSFGQADSLCDHSNEIATVAPTEVRYLEGFDFSLLFVCQQGKVGSREV